LLTWYAILPCPKWRDLPKSFGSGTIFHEFGHTLHHVLTKVDEPAVAGIAGVEWDAVELPSQLTEAFVWEWEVLQRLTAHRTTREALPHDLFQKMRAAKNFQTGMALVRQLEFSFLICKYTLILTLMSRCFPCWMKSAKK